MNPTYVDDAQTLKRVPLRSYDLVLADPPYSVEDAERYQTTMIKRNAVLRALQAVSAGTHIVWLDQVLPMYRKDAFAIDAVIGMVKSTNHRFRVATIFRRLAATMGVGESKSKQLTNEAVKGTSQSTLEAVPYSIIYRTSCPNWVSLSVTGSAVRWVDGWNPAFPR